MTAIAWDTETKLIAPPDQIPPDLICGSFAEVDIAPQGTLLDASDTCDLLEDLLRDPSVKIVGANIAFDIHVSIKRRPELLDLWITAADDNRVHDVLLRQGLIDLSRGEFKHKYNLGDLSRWYLKVDLDKTEDSWRLRYAELEGLPVSAYPYEAKKYAILDAECTARLFMRQERENHSPYFVGLSPLKDEFNQVRASIWLTAVSNAGLPVDPTKADLLAKGYRERELELREVMLEHGFLRKKVSRNMAAVKLLPKEAQKDVFKRYKEAPDDLVSAGLVAVEYPRDTKAVSRALADSLRAVGMEPRRTDGHKPGVSGPYECIALDREATSLSDDEVVKAYSEYSSVLKSLSTDVPMLQNAVGGKIHTHFTTLKETGRTSSGGPNIQNWGRKGDTRACVVAPVGECIIETDFKALELRTFGQIYYWLFGPCRMSEVLNSEADDVHSMGVSMFTGMTYDEVIKRKEEPEIDNYRTSLKGAVFGRLGGLGAKTFVTYAKTQYNITLDLSRAKQLFRDIDTAWPEIKRYLDWINRLERQGSGGRFDVIQFATNRLRAGIAYTQAANSPFQGLGADVTKRGGWALWKATITPGDPLFGASIVNMVHDSFLTIVKKEVAKEAKARQESILVTSQEELLPNIKGGVSSKIMDFWHKTK
jgi:DNA polymerase-1